MNLTRAQHDFTVRRCNRGCYACDDLSVLHNAVSNAKQFNGTQLEDHQHKRVKLHARFKYHCEKAIVHCVPKTFSRMACVEKIKHVLIEYIGNDVGHTN